MHYHYHKRRYPNDVLVYIEEFNKDAGTVLFDFIDSNEYKLFTSLTDGFFDLDKPTMVLLNNYKMRTIQENTIYSIKPEVIETWQEQISNTSNNLNSLLIRYIIDVSITKGELFSTSVSINDSFDFYYNDSMNGRGNCSQISFPFSGKISITVRNVGQGNWNEIIFDEEVKIVYDAGAPMNASRTEVTRIIGNRNILYSSSRPILILSHWYKDHYHALLGMTNVQLEHNFSAFICRDRVPNVTSRILFGRVSTAIGLANTFTISADQRQVRGGPTYLRNVTPRTKQIVLYNAQHHKNRNISGLLLSVKSARASVILTGDAHYEQISRDILPHLNYTHQHNLIVPHHGGKAGAYIYETPPLMTVDKAVISVGANRYGHPDAKYIASLKADNFFIQQTSVLLDDILIKL